jgi:hypothetical protein
MSENKDTTSNSQQKETSTSSTTSSTVPNPESASSVSENLSNDVPLKKTQSKVYMIRQTFEQAAKSPTSSPEPVVKKKGFGEKFKKVFGFWHTKSSERSSKETLQDKDLPSKSTPATSLEIRQRSATVSLTQVSQSETKISFKNETKHSRASNSKQNLSKTGSISNKSQSSVNYPSKEEENKKKISNTEPRSEKLPSRTKESTNDSTSRPDHSKFSKEIAEQNIQYRSHSLPSTPVRKDKNKPNVSSLSRSQKPNEQKPERTRDTPTSMSTSKSVTLIESETSSQSQSHPPLRQKTEVQNTEKSSMETTTKNEKQ